MKEKKGLLYTGPAGVAAEKLTTPELARLARTSQENRQLYQTLLEERKEEHLAVQEVLRHLVRGEDEELSVLLTKNINLLYKRSSITDLSGRTFESISPWEYIVWSLDKHRCDRVLDLIPKDKKGNEVLKHLISQHKALPIEEKKTEEKEEKVQTQHGVTYTRKLNDEVITVTETHYDFAIIGALQEYVSALKDHPAETNWDALNERWREVVGGAQRLLPVPVVDEYCSDQPFEERVPFESYDELFDIRQYKTQQFKIRPIPLKEKQQFYNWQSDNWESWFNSQLGVEFAMIKDGDTCTGASELPGGGLAIELDLAAMETLFETRKEDFSDVLEARLQSMLVVEEQPRPGN